MWSYVTFKYMGVFFNQILDKKGDSTLKQIWGTEKLAVTGWNWLLYTLQPDYVEYSAHFNYSDSVCLKNSSPIAEKESNEAGGIFWSDPMSQHLIVGLNYSHFWTQWYANPVIKDLSTV